MPDNGRVSIHVIKWLSSQPFTNVLLIVQMAGIGWLGYYAVTKLIPSQIEAIQNGYDRQADKQTKDLEKVIQSYERTLDRISPLSRLPE